MNSAEVAFKAVVLSGRKKDGQSIHRFRGTFTWDQIVDVFGHLMSLPSRSIVIEYTDEDGDTVQVRSAMEWDECLRLHVAQRREAPLRIAVRCEKPRRRAASPSNTSDSEASERRSVPASVLHSDPTSSVFRESRYPVLNPMSTICGSLGFSSVAEATECRDDRTSLLRTMTVNEANRLIDLGSGEEAAALLSEGLLVFPESTVMIYNLACALAISGNHALALEKLELAIQKGYRDLKHIEEDHDLDSIRQYPQYTEILRFHLAAAPKRPVKTEREAPVEVPTTQQAPAAQAAEVTSSPAIAPALTAALMPVPAEVATTAPVPVLAEVATTAPVPVLAEVLSQPEAVVAPAAVVPQLQLPQRPSPRIVGAETVSSDPLIGVLQSVFPQLSADEAKMRLAAANRNVELAIHWLLSGR